MGTPNARSHRLHDSTIGSEAAIVLPAPDAIGSSPGMSLGEHMGAANIALAKCKEMGSHILAQRKPWSELLDRTAYSRPANMTEATGRVRKNVNYFKVNYLVWMVTVLLVCMLASPSA